MIRKTFGALALCALAACGNQGGSDMGAALRGAAKGIFSRGKTPEVVAPTTEDLRGLTANGAALRVSVPKFGSVAGAVPIGVNNGKVTWVAGAATLTTQSGFLLATRGLTGDLMAVEVEGFGAALGGGGTYSRSMEWLNGRDETIRMALTCTITIKKDQTVAVLEQAYAATLYEDVCVGETLQFTNKYWIDSEKQLRQTRQFVSETVGYLQTQQL